MAPRTSTVKKPVSEPKVEEADASEDEREFQRQAQLVLDLLADNLPHTRQEIGDWAKQNGISDSTLGRVKKAYAIDHVRVQSGDENGLGRSRFAWILNAK